MKILNLYAGILGNANEWNDPNDEITHVEINPEICEQIKKKRPKDNVVCGDAHEFLLKNLRKYDFIWSSPPCPTHSKMMKATRHKVSFYPDMKLYEEILLLKHFFNGKYCIENVQGYYEPLIHPQKIGRHFMWSNIKLTSIEVPKIKDMTKAKRQELVKYLGLDYEGNIYLNGGHDPLKVLRNCVHPKIGNHILNLAKGIVEQNNSEQVTIFDVGA